MERGAKIMMKERNRKKIWVDLICMPHFLK